MIWIARARVELITNDELAKGLKDWKDYAESNDKLLVGIRDELKQTQDTSEINKQRVKRLDEECMNLTREQLRDRLYIRLLEEEIIKRGGGVPKRPD
jgi:hypothetical protein